MPASMDTKSTARDPPLSVILVDVGFLAFEQKGNTTAHFWVSGHVAPAVFLLRKQPSFMHGAISPVVKYFSKPC